MPERTGLVAAGNFIIDHVKMIDAYPEPEMLTNIRSQSSSNGGGPYNVLKDLAKMEAPFPLEAVGLIGQDAHGDWVVADCEEHGIATWGLKRSAAAATSYTDAMTVVQGGQRTFFHHRGGQCGLWAGGR
ncbi:PfkB family carbohydrate kinase [Verrucomicrobiales bacterium]|nr:PfkB family carbohydrate kinase [Verrucomicrobiales bacterium]